MNGAAIARVAKLGALLGFFLPWVLVSCSGQRLGTISGLSLAIGDIAVKNPMNGAVEHHHASPNLFLLLAMIVIVGGLALSLGGTKEDRKRSPKILCVAAISAALLCVLGVSTLNSSRGQTTAGNGSANELASAMASGMLQVTTQYGFWVTLLALATAAATSGLIVADRESLLKAVGAEVRRATRSDDDQRFWDSLTDKTNRDALEEYLHRFPQGQFAELARSRLKRSEATAPSLNASPDTGEAMAPASSEPPAPDKGEKAQSGLVCAACQAPASIGDRFCAECGTALTT